MALQSRLDEPRRRPFKLVDFFQNRKIPESEIIRRFPPSSRWGGTSVKLKCQGECHGLS
jgi:hypothetical protein